MQKVWIKIGKFSIGLFDLSSTHAISTAVNLFLERIFEYNFFRRPTAPIRLVSNDVEFPCAFFDLYV